MDLLFLAPKIRKASLIFFLIFFSSLPSDAYQKPLLEYGMFLGHGGLADYPASDEYRYRTLPFPYLNYHGDFFSSESENGTRLRFIRDEDFDLDLSFGGSFPTETNNNTARAGMPSLDWTLEVGPRLLYYFYRNPEKGNIRLGLPYRASFATDFQRGRHVGYLFSPTLQFDKYSFLSDHLNVYLILTANYFSEGEADFFYEIEPQYATADRRAYDAKAGWLSFDTSVSAKYEIDKKIFLVGAQYSDFSGSANKESFLHRTDHSLSYFIGFGILFFESEEKVD
ncbi:MAG: hypothetical protein K0R29_1141 [Pseudobdellovibrio sp.]|jgi:outer membrane scaffolding protein for murein synthesis (MipA/OmpV family)|nr:hypothetical protein [Pseudobdellovibrio sp.]